MEQLTARLDGVPGTVSVWAGPLDGPAYYVRESHHWHYAASMMKVAVLVALHRGDTPLDTEILIHNDFSSAAPTPARFGCERRHDQDDEVWRRLGHTASLRWLADRMITRSSNLATNLALEQTGLEPVSRIWRQVGARHSVVSRGLGDQAAADAGLTNVVTAADLALLLSSIATDQSPQGSAMIATLMNQHRTEDLAAGLPPGTRVAHKNGWVMGARHAAGVIYPLDAPPFVLAVCSTTPLAVNQTNDRACQIVAEVTRSAWAHRHAIAAAV